MGTICPLMVVTSSDRQGRPKQLKPTNTQWITVIQGAYADGTTIPPFIIFKGKQLSQSWFQPGLPHDWRFQVSENGWSLDDIGLEWIHHFHKHTYKKKIGSRRLLILDNYGSHTTVQFRQFCKDNQIILLWMLPHSLHLC